jgi:hypothetical protein
MNGGKREATHLRVEDKLGSFEEMQVPHAGNSVGFVDSHRVLVVRGDEELGELDDARRHSATKGKNHDRTTTTHLWTPINTRHAPPSAPPLLVPTAQQPHPCSIRLRAIIRRADRVIS